MQASMLTPTPISCQSDHFTACYRIPGAQGGEAERAQQVRELRGLLARRQDDCVRLLRPDAQSLGCRYPSLPDNSPSPNLSAPTLAAASLELKASKENAHSRNINSVAYNHDGTRIVSACNGGTIKVWDAGESALTPSNP